MRKLLIAVILFLGIFFVIAQFAELEKIFETLRKGQWQFLVLAGFVQLIWFWNVAASYNSIYRSLGIHERLDTLGGKMEIISRPGQGARLRAWIPYR